VCGVCGRASRRIYDRKLRWVRDLSAGDTRIYLEIESRRVRCRSCARVKQEKLAWLSDNPFYTKRFAFFVGRHCRTSTIQDVARELHLDWRTVKELDQQYMQEQLRRAGTPGPRAIGIDEVSTRKGHTYRIVVSDLERHRPIWLGGQDRSEASLDLFYQSLGAAKTKRIQLAVMDMWKPFRNSTRSHAAQASILFDKFHVMRHLGEALDQVRKSEYARLRGKDRSVIKGQKYTLLSHRDNLTSTAAAPFRSSFKPTAGSTSPICSRNPLVSFGTTDARLGRSAFWRTGKRHLDGSGSSPTRSSRP
jgi:transposase